MMTLGNLLYDIEQQLRKTEEELNPYLYISSVKRFLQNRKEDLEEFKRLTRGYDFNESNYKICSDLKVSSESKIYGGICLKGADYFKVPKYIKKIIEEDILEECEDYTEAPKINFDASFAIPDELDSETFDSLYGDAG